MLLIWPLSLSPALIAPGRLPGAPQGRGTGPPRGRPIWPAAPVGAPAPWRRHTDPLPPRFATSWGCCFFTKQLYQHTTDILYNSPT